MDEEEQVRRSYPPAGRTSSEGFEGGISIIFFQFPPQLNPVD